MSKKIFKCATCGKSDNVKVVKLEDGCNNDYCDYECFLIMIIVMMIYLDLVKIM